MLFFGVSIVSGFFLHTQGLGLPARHPEVIEAVFSIFCDWDSIRTYLFWFLVVLVTTITLLVNEKFELGVDVLLSEKLVRALPPAIGEAARALGAFSFRGKSDEIVVYMV